MTDRARLARAARAGLVGLLAGLAVSACGSSGHAAAPLAKLRRAGGGIPASLRAGERPIGAGARYQPPATGPVVGRCSAPLGRRQRVHVEVFGNDRVVLLAAGIGTRGPRRYLFGSVVRAHCFGALVTLDDTGVVYFRPGARVTLAALFRAWGQPLTGDRVASFTGGSVTVYVNGHLRRGAPGSTPLRPGAEIVVEVGPHVPPHRRFVFMRVPPAAGMR